MGMAELILTTCTLCAFVFSACSRVLQHPFYPAAEGDPAYLVNFQSNLIYKLFKLSVFLGIVV
jgi:hypothetical protein